jgi:hypothetical protein
MKKDADSDKFLDDFFDEHPEYREPLNKGTEIAISRILERLFLDGKIDENRIHDLKYVWDVVIQNLDLLDNLPLQRERIDKQIMESAKDAAKLGRIPVVLILVATAIEHNLNIFYRDALENYSGLSSDEATEAIRSNASAKLGWLLHLVARDGISDPLLKRIKQIFDLRNAFVHYKAVIVPLNETDKATELIEKVNNIGLDNILNTPDEVESELAAKILTLIPAYRKADQLAADIAKRALSKK